MKRNFIFLAFILLAACGQPKEAGLVGLLNNGVQYNKARGAIVAIHENGETNYYPVGYADDEKKPIDKYTLFEIGSISKTFTTLLMAKAVSEGKINLEDPINKYLPDTLRLADFKGEKITIKSLANATSGLPRMPENFSPRDENNPYIDYTVKELLEFLNTYELKRAPYETYEYSNLGMGLLGYILTIVYEKPYNEILKENILDPLNMNRTSVNYVKKLDDNISVGYNASSPDKLTPTSYWEWTDESVLVGAGGIISCADDLMKYLKAQTGLVKFDLEEEMTLTQRPTKDTGEPNMQIGLGWHIKNGKIIWHGGGTGGFRTFAGIDKASEKIVLILANSDVPISDLGFEELE